MEGKNESNTDYNIELLQQARVVILGLLSVADDDKFETREHCLRAEDFLTSTKILRASAPALLEENENLRKQLSEHGTTANRLLSANSDITSLRAEVDRLTKEKSEAIEALKAFVIDIDGHPSYAAREHYKPIMDKAKDLLTRIK